MISASLERCGQIGKEAVPVMRNGRCLPVHQPRSAHDFSAICFGDALMSQANTQNWSPCAKRQNDVFTDPRLDRKSTRLNSSHTVISYAVFCLKKKKKL